MHLQRYKTSSRDKIIHKCTVSIINHYQNTVAGLQVAEQLGVCAVIGLCEDFLGQPTVDNAVYHFAIAERFGLEHLRACIYQFVVERQAIC